MAAVDLLLAAQPTYERLHQAALFVLLRETRLFEHLTGAPSPAKEIGWEPSKGCFDLAIGGQKVLIELKVDSDLKRKQLHDQIKHAEKVKAEQVVYLLLGRTGITRGTYWHEWSELAGQSVTPRVYDATAVLAALRKVQGEDSRQDVLELAGAFERMLVELDQRTKRYEGRLVESFTPDDYLGFFHELRQVAQLKGNHGARVQYVSNESGGFIACAWGGTETPVAGVYLQFEGPRLRLKIHVSGDSPKAARKAAASAVSTVAPSFPELGVVHTKEKVGKSMTVAELSKVQIVSNPRAPELLAKLKEAEAFLQATADTLRAAKPSS